MLPDGRALLCAVIYTDARGIAGRLSHRRYPSNARDIGRNSSAYGIKVLAKPQLTWSTDFVVVAGVVYHMAIAIR